MRKRKRKGHPAPGAFMVALLDKLAKDKASYMQWTDGIVARWLEHLSKEKK